jgi:iron complex outermembrane recepter protein
MSHLSITKSCPNTYPRAIALAVHFVLITGFALPVMTRNGAAQAADTSTAARQPYQIGAGSLGEVLSRFAALSGMRISFDPALVAGRRSAGLQGSYTTAEGVARLLDGSDLELLSLGDGNFSLRKIPVVRTGQSKLSAPEAMLATVLVTAGTDAPSYVAHDARSATKSTTPLLETARSVSVVTEEQMRERRVNSVEDAVAYTAGVQTAGYGDDPRFDQVSVRGFDVTTDADYRDGLRQPNTGWLSYFRTEPYALERLEIVKGPNSVLFGQISPGGMINRVSKRPTRDTLREVEVQAGNNDLLQGLFDFGGALTDDGTLLYRATGLVRQANTGTIGVNDDSQYFAPALTWMPSDKTTVTFLSHWQHYETSGSPQQYQYPSGELSRFWGGDIDFDGLKQTQYALGYEAEHRFNDTFRLRQNLRYAHVDTDNQYLEASSLDSDGVTIQRDAYGVYETMRTFAVDTALESRFSTGPLTHQLTTGIDYAAIDGDVLYAYGSAPSINMSSPNYHQTIARPSDILVSQDVRGKQTGLYLNDQVTLDRWRLTLGLRHDRADQTQDDKLTATSSSQHDKAVTGNLGLLYRFDNALAPYVSFATSFIPQFGTNVYGDTFKPTEGKQIEAGVKYQPAGWGMHTLSLFNLVQQNVKTVDPDNVMNYVQTGEVRSRGVELESSMSLKNGLDLVASYTFQAMEVTKSNDGNEGKRPVGIPSQMAAIWAKYRFQSAGLNGFDMGLGMRWIGKTYADAANSQMNDGYTIVDARLGYDLKNVLPGASLALNATNLSDKEYLMCHDGYCYRGRGRSIVGSLNYRW